MKLNQKNILIYLFVAIFCIGLGSSITINMQYGINSTFNEIEHSDSNPTNTINEIIEEHAKLCEKLIDFDFKLIDRTESNLAIEYDLFKYSIYLKHSTPPPECIV